MSARRRTVGVPMLARPRREVVELHVRRHRALGEAIVWAIDFGMAVFVAGLSQYALFMWWTR